MKQNQNEEHTVQTEPTDEAVVRELSLDEIAAVSGGAADIVSKR
jgi:hypothetical protein